MATLIELGLCTASPEAVRAAMPDTPTAGLGLCSALTTESSIFVRWLHANWENRDINMPASHGMPAYRFCADESEQPSRPFRLKMHSNPKDGDALQITEIGGVRIAP